MSPLNRNSLLALLAEDGRTTDERERLARLMWYLAAMPDPPDPCGLMPRYGEFREKFVETASGEDGEAAEEAFLHFYCHLHGHEAPYSEAERRRVDETGGYWSHAGGLSPILKAGPHIRPETVLGDFGAGNGLQGLLIQMLHPHAQTVQIEISARMVEAGRALQSWFGIPDERVKWVVGDVLDASAAGMDFIYLYRPVRPTGEGRRFYEKLAAELASDRRPVVIFSIADCLKDFLGVDFEVFFTDGHLTCFPKGLQAMSDLADNDPAMYYERAELYDRIYDFKDYEADADVLHAVLLGEGVADGSRLLEAACGTGSFLGPLSRHYDAAGFDLSPAMLAIARGKLPDTEIFVADMRDFTVPEQFDALVCLFSSIGYLLTDEDLAECFGAFRRALRPGGVTVVEPFVRPEDWRDDAAHLMTYEGEDLKCCRANVSKREGDISTLDFHWLVVRPGVGVEHFTETHRLRLWRVEEMGRILGDAGFDWRFEDAGRGRFVGRAI